MRAAISLPTQAGTNTQVSVLQAYSEIRFSFKKILGVTTQWLLKFDFLHAIGNGGIDSRKPAAQTQLIHLEQYHLAGI